ncbi:MAG: MATE family efflux transporter [Lachnospiraceae bacterium]|nr:MATE family efflux transporter [Lachnospiraceae bacterium]
MKNNSRSKAVDMTQGPILGKLVQFCLPIFLGLVFQQFYSMVDSIVVGKYVSADALAAVGTSAPMVQLLIGIMAGFNLGASVVASQYVGANQKDKIKPTISTTAITLIVLSLFITVIAIVFAPDIMRLISVPDNILKDTVIYFRIFSAGCIFLAMYNFFASFLRSMGDSTTPLIFLIISSLLNIGGDLFFVLVLKHGVDGVAYATVIAQAISVILCIIYVSRTNEYFQFKKGEFVFDPQLFKSILRMGIPSSLQTGLSSIGMVAVQRLINSYGSVCIASYTAANKMEMICNLPVTSMAQGLSLYVGQNIGAGKTDRAKKGMWQSMIVCAVIGVVLTVLIYAFGPNLMRLFVNDEDIEVINIGTQFMRIWAPLVVLHGISSIVVSFLRGSGDSLFAMISMFADLLTRSVMAYIFAWSVGLGFMGIAYAIPCGWGMTVLIAFARYFTGGWKKKAVTGK